MSTQGPHADALAVVPLDAASYPSKSEPPTTKTFAVQLGSVTYALAWLGIYTLHAACALHCFAAGVLLDGVDDMIVAFQLNFYSVTLPTKYFHAFALVHYVLGSIHTSFLVVGVGQLFYRGYNWWGGPKIEPSRSTTSAFLSRVASQIPQTLERRINRKLKKVLVTIYERVFAPRGLLGVEFQHFDAIFLLRELTETVLQSNQAYQMCRLLTRLSITRFYVAILVINCWTTPLLHHFVASKPLQRLLAHLCDVVLDFVSTVVVPVMLVLHYVSEYDRDFEDFPLKCWYDDLWFIQAVKETPLILFGSWVDAGSRLMFSLSLLSSLQDIKRLLQKRRSRVQVLKKSLANSSMRSLAKRQLSRVLRICHWLMIVYGVGILSVHLYAETRPSPESSCALVVKPWLVGQPACAFVEVNCCKHPELNGNGSDFERIMGDLDPLALAQITFRHCPAVEIQPSIQTFPNLIGIKLYNSTLVSWDMDAAFVQQHHPKMRYMVLVRTTFPNATIPQGLLSPDFPVLLHDLEFSVTNIRWVPENLDKVWPPEIQFILEHSQMTEYPPVLARVQFAVVNLIDNPISSLPAMAFEAQGPFLLEVAGCPITYLPEDVDISGMTIYVVNLYATNLTALPVWMVDEAFWKRKRFIKAGRTPLCENVVLKATEEEMQAHSWLRELDCADYGSDLGTYPLYLEVKDDEVW